MPPQAAPPSRPASRMTAQSRTPGRRLLPKMAMAIGLVLLAVVILLAWRLRPSRERVDEWIERQRAAEERLRPFLMDTGKDSDQSNPVTSDQ